MKLLFSFLLFCNACFSQSKMSYYFDTLLTENVKYGKEAAVKSMVFTNSKDSTYSMRMKDGAVKKITLLDARNGYHITIDVDSSYRKFADLNNLKKANIIYSSKIKKGKNKAAVVDMISERDTVNNTRVVHFTTFKNKKRKKNLAEQYVFIGKEAAAHTEQYKNFLKTKYNVAFGPDENIERIVNIYEGFVMDDHEPVSVENIDFNFNFLIDGRFP